MKSKNSKACKDITVEIDGAAEHVFVKKADVMSVLSENNIRTGGMLNDIDLRKVEEQLEQNAWVSTAELFFDNTQVLHANISEREPVARVFTVQGSSFYIDSSGLRLPASESATARVAVFTSFPSNRKVLSTPDSLVLMDVTHIANYIHQDSFFREQTAQVNITQQGTYELVPVVGNQLIRLGDAENLDEKFQKLFYFYKQVWSKSGFEKYAVIDVQYHEQVVAERRGENDVLPDTSTAMIRFAQADKKLKKALSDTVYAAPVAATVVDSAGAVAERSVSGKQKTNANKTANETGKKGAAQKPKAVMPRKN
jgi:cell division protein FtsQ